MTVSTFHRGRFRELTGATVVPINDNSWSITIPVEVVASMLRETVTVASLDDKLFLLDTTEFDNVIGHKLSKTALHVTIWRL
jgi:hypothetical protein